jgi:hypothetical protein
MTFRKYILKHLCILNFKKKFVFIFFKYAGVKASHEKFNFWMKKRIFTLLFLISRVLEQIPIFNWNFVFIYNTVKQIKKNSGTLCYLSLTGKFKTFVWKSKLEEKKRILGFQLDLKPHKVCFFDISTKFYKKSSPKTLNLVNISKKKICVDMKIGFFLHWKRK